MKPRVRMSPYVTRVNSGIVSLNIIGESHHLKHHLTNDDTPETTSWDPKRALREMRQKDAKSGVTGRAANFEETWLLTFTVVAGIV